MTGPSGAPEERDWSGTGSDHYPPRRALPPAPMYRDRAAAEAIRTAAAPAIPGPSSPPVAAPPAPQELCLVIVADGRAV